MLIGKWRHEVNETPTNSSVAYGHGGGSADPDGAEPRHPTADQAAPAGQVQGVDAGKAEEVSRDQLFASTVELCRRFDVSGPRMAKAFEGKTVLVKWVDGEPLLRVIDVERIFG
jgi:hypothetical protein